MLRFTMFEADILSFCVALLALGSFAGLLAGLLGVGGGIILVPGLYSVFSYFQKDIAFDPAHLMHICVGTSLAVIVPTGLSSARAHHKKGQVSFNIVRQIGAGIIIGVICGSYIANLLDAHVMKTIFACAVVILSAIMAVNPARMNKGNHAFSTIGNAIAGVFIGTISTLIGIGGATLSVPYLGFQNIPIHRAVGTASALGLVISIPAAIGFMIIGFDQLNLPPYSIGYVNILAWGCIIPASVLAAPLGAGLAHKISVGKLRIIFAVFMLVVALNILFRLAQGL